MFKNMKIGTRLGFGFGLVLLLLVVMSIMTIIQIRSIKTSVDVIVNDRFPKTVLVNEIIDDINIVARALRNMALLSDSSKIEAEHKRILEARSNVEKKFDKLTETVKSTEGGKILEAALSARKAYFPVQDEIIRLLIQRKKDVAVSLLLGEFRTLQNHYIDCTSDLIKFQTELTNEDGETGITTSKNAETILYFLVSFILIFSIIAAVVITRSITGPIGECIKIADKVATGDTDISIDTDSRDETGQLLNSLGKMIESIRRLVIDSGMLSKAAVEGKLDTRADASKHQGDFRKIVEGVNNTLDAVIGPLNVAAEYVDRISKGDIPQKITDTYHGDFNEIKNNLNQCIDSLNTLISQMNHMADEHNKGDIDVQIDTVKFQGVYKTMAQETNNMVNGHINVKKKAMACVSEFGRGNFDAPLEKFPGKKAFINDTIEDVRLNLKNIAKELNTLIDSSKNGSLSTRGNAAAYQGDWRAMIHGVNEILDAILMPINEAAVVLDKVAARDMTARVVGEYKGDHAKIKNSLNMAVDNLDKALQQVTEATEQVSSASGQISLGSQSLAQGANEQASSLEEVSSSLEEMASMTKQNAGNANQAKGLAAESDGNAKTGTEAMNRMSGAINRIKESSDQTAKIVKTIDEIAMQTNLLALNAAVEAARAGEAGRGFAVVAEEVRNLAQRSAQAAKNTADMITESVKNADEGVKIAVEVSQSFETIATSAKKVNDLIAEIAAASQEQSLGIEQINIAVSQMDNVTQQNAANSEESASAAEELNSQSEELKNMITQFALSRNIMSASAPGKMAKSHTFVHSGVKEKGSIKTNAKKPSGKTTSIKSEDIIPLDDDVLKEF
ncbi:MAG: MCP four helix bundle domain-containing protein [Chitinispirillaceae bacterium]|nr:MCP four helix bundle domain-containing protein [Chitinispirillaceae bacterium]